MKISTTTGSSSSQLSNPSTVVLSMEPASAMNITNVNTNNTTTAILLDERVCGHQIDSTRKCKCLYALKSSRASLKHSYGYMKANRRSYYQIQNATNIIKRRASVNQNTHIIRSTFIYQIGFLLDNEVCKQMLFMFCRIFIIHVKTPSLHVLTFYMLHTK